MRKFLLSRSRRAVVFKQLNCWWYMDTTVIPADFGTTILSVSENACTLGDMSTPPLMNTLFEGSRYFFASGHPLAFVEGGLMPLDMHRATFWRTGSSLCLLAQYPFDLKGRGSLPASMLSTFFCCHSSDNHVLFFCYP